MRYPLHMTLELTAKCNFRCPYCYCVWHEYPALAKPELDTAGWMAVLDKCAADGVTDVLFTGGEALLRRVHLATSLQGLATYGAMTGTRRSYRRLLEKWGDRNRAPCPAGKDFGVVGPNGLYRTCLHSLPRDFNR